ncbi:hypothetical protein GCM10010245_91990 [Streptomyces spectabilis]|nr:hypothetical protein GCM10010245_91990 [Streptomyces spectabilis]
MGNSTTTYSPGLTFTPTYQSYTNNTAYTSCTSSGNTVVSGTSSKSYQGTSASSCLSPLLVSPGSEVIHWNTGDTSTFTFDATVTQIGALTVITRTGTITSGMFAGATATHVTTAEPLNTPQCLTPPGITSREAIDELTITEL